MKETFDIIMPRLFKHEGGFVNHPRDPGGATKYGITHKTLANWRKSRVTKTDVRRLTQAEAKQIYRKQYWAQISGDSLPAGLDYAVFDFGVNSGPRFAAKMLQRVLGVEEDGIVGPKTLRAAESVDTKETVRALCAVRLRFLKRLKNWKTFGRGWQRRVDEVLEQALLLVVPQKRRNWLTRLIEMFFRRK